MSTASSSITERHSTESPFVSIRSVNTADRNGPDRRSRASQASAEKRAYENEHGVTLTRFSTSYSETYGFAHASYFRYRVTPGTPRRASRSRTSRG
jgi:hypothetical protein